MYRPLQTLPPVSRDPGDILKLFGPQSQTIQNLAKRALGVERPILGTDLEYRETIRYIEEPTVLGVSDGHLSVSVPFDEGLAFFRELRQRHPNILFVGHAFTSADKFAFRQVGEVINLEDIEDTIIRFFLTNAHLCKTGAKVEDGDGEKRGKGYMNLWTFLSLYTDFYNYKDCWGPSCRGEFCPKHDVWGYNGADSSGPIFAIPQILTQSKIRGVDKLYPLHRELAYVLGEMSRYGVQVDREYLFGKGDGSTRGLQGDFEFNKQRIEESLPFNPKSNKAALAYFKGKGIELKDWTEDTIRKGVEEYEDEELALCLDYKELGNGTDRWFAPVSKDKSGDWVGYMDQQGKIHPRLGMFCVDEETECLTQRGWKKREDLIVGELAASYDMKESKLEWEPIKAVHTFEVSNEPMIKMKARSLDMLVTRNHRCVVRSERWKDYTEKIKLAEDLNYSDAVIVTAPWKNVGYSPVSKEMAELIGWFLAEGFAKKEGNAIDIYQSETANPEKTHRIEQLLISLEAEYEKASYQKYYPKKKRYYTYVAFHINGFVAAKIREMCSEKALPKNVLSWQERELTALLDGFLQGDGGRKGNGWTLTQKKGIVQDENLEMLHAVAIRLGLPASRYQEGKYPRTGIRINSKRFHRVAPEGIRRHNSKHPYDVVQYSGKVWCPEMNNTTWVMRRNGYVAITGNTSTGRLQCTSPNLQNVAKRRMDRHICECREKKEAHPGCGHDFKGASLGKMVRRAIIASPGYYLLKADYSNAENRVFLYLGGHHIPNEVDLHLRVMNMANFTEDMEFAIRLGGAREAAKSVQHSGNYLEGLQLKYPAELRTARVRAEIDAGARLVFPDWTFNGKIVTFTGSNLARRAFGDASWPNRAKALEVASKYFGGFPGARELQKRITKQAETQKAIIVPHGYYLLSFGDDEERCKTGAAMYGSNPVAHFTKLALVDLWRKFQAGRPLRPVLQIHDEILCEVPLSVDPREAAGWLRESMEIETPEIPGLILPIGNPSKGELASYGPNWNQMKAVKI